MYGGPEAQFYGGLVTVDGSDNIPTGAPGRQRETTDHDQDGGDCGCSGKSKGMAVAKVAGAAFVGFLVARWMYR